MRDSRWVLAHVSAVSAVALGGLLLLGAAGQVVSAWQAGPADGWSGTVQSNWLIVLFKMNAGVHGADPSLLDLNPVDVTILLLGGVVLLGLYPTLRAVSRPWALIAVAQPYVGLILFIATRMAGRLGLATGVLIASALLHRGHAVNPALAGAGLPAGALVIPGDALTEVAQTSLNAALLAVGYMLLMAWFLLIAVRLGRLSPRCERAEGSRVSRRGRTTRARTAHIPRP